MLTARRCHGCYDTAVQLFNHSRAGRSLTITAARPGIAQLCAASGPGANRSRVPDACWRERAQSLSQPPAAALPGEPSALILPGWVREVPAAGPFQPALMLQLASTAPVHCKQSAVSQTIVLPTVLVSRPGNWIAHAKSVAASAAPEPTVQPVARRLGHGGLSLTMMVVR